MLERLIVNVLLVASCVFWGWFLLVTVLWFERGQGII